MSWYWPGLRGKGASDEMETVHFWAPAPSTTISAVGSLGKLCVASGSCGGNAVDDIAVLTSIEHDMPQWTSQTRANSAGRDRRIMVLRGSWRDGFSLVTGRGKRPSSDDGLAWRFSSRLLREGAEAEESVEPADEVERLVFLRSRIVGG